MRIAKLFLFFPLFLFSAAVAQNPADQVVAEALKPSPLETNLQRLTDEIGGRIPGTVAMRKAVDWGVAGFKAAGADSVHTENFTIPASWAEGFTRMSVVAPEQFEVRAVSMAWAPALAARQDVPIVDVGEGKPEDFVNAAPLIFNQDFSLNSVANPASRGTVVVLFVTGAGQTRPASVDGQIWEGLGTIEAPVSAEIQHVSSASQKTQLALNYAGPVPAATSGVQQLNIVIPETLPVIFVSGVAGGNNYLNVTVGDQVLTVPVVVR